MRPKAAANDGDNSSQREAKKEFVTSCCVQSLPMITTATTKLYSIPHARCMRKAALA